MEQIIFLPLNVPSLKNSKIKTARGIFPSKTVKRYLQNLGIQRYSSSRKEVIEYKTKPNIFKDILEKTFNDLNREDNPYVIGFHFVRKTKHKFDFNNANQIIADLMTAHDMIEDDNMDYFIPVPFKMHDRWYSYDKENPGVFIKIFNNDNIIINE